MAKVGDKTHTQHGVGTITEVDTVRGRTQYRVAGAGFNVWLDETKIHVANEGGMFAFRPMDEYAEEARNAPQYGLGLDPSIEHFAGLDATIEPGSTPVNENNSTALPYDWTPQYHHDVWADEQTIQPGEQEIDSDDRLKATDSVSGNRVDERPYPGPNPDLFAKSSARLGYYDEDYDDAPYTGEGGTSDDYYDQPAEDFHFFRTPPTVHRPGGDHRWDGSRWLRQAPRLERGRPGGLVRRVSDGPRNRRGLEHRPPPACDQPRLLRGRRARSRSDRQADPRLRLGTGLHPRRARHPRPFAPEAP